MACPPLSPSIPVFGDCTGCDAVTDRGKTLLGFTPVCGVFGFGVGTSTPAVWRRWLRYHTRRESLGQVFEETVTIDRWSKLGDANAYIAGAQGVNYLYRDFSIVPAGLTLDLSGDFNAWQTADLNAQAQQASTTAEVQSITTGVFTGRDASGAVVRRRTTTLSLELDRLNFAQAIVDGVNSIDFDELEWGRIGSWDHDLAGAFFISSQGGSAGQSPDAALIHRTSRIDCQKSGVQWEIARETCHISREQQAMTATGSIDFEAGTIMQCLPFDGGAIHEIIVSPEHPSANFITRTVVVEYEQPGGTYPGCCGVPLP